MKSPVKGHDVAPVPLFDRLIDDNPDVHFEAKPYRTLDRAGLRRSVRREVERLMNTRAPQPEGDMKGRERTVIDFGIPDFGTFGTLSGVDHFRLARIIEEHIQIFEPRLREVHVTIEKLKREEGRLAAHLEGTIVSGDVTEPVAFPIHVDEAAS